MKSGKIILISVFIILFNACKDVIFNNPLDPGASKAQFQVIKVISTPVYGPGDFIQGNSGPVKVQDRRQSRRSALVVLIRVVRDGRYET